MDNKLEWQIGKPMEETNLYMLDNEISSDVSFLVGVEKSNTCEIKAHKFMLISRNPVFYVMFEGENSTNQNHITIPDIEPDAFRTLLRFVYSSSCHITFDTVLSTLYASKKYIIPSLTEKCKLFLEENLNCENVCLIYEQSIFYDEQDLMEKCKLFLETRTEEVLTSPIFTSISGDALKHFLKLSHVSVSEIDLYRACLRWGKQECIRRGLISENDDSLKSVLGDFLELIHFPSMSLKEFTEVSKGGLLSPVDRCAIFEYLVSSENEKEECTSFIKYSAAKRMKPEPFVLTRFVQFCKSNVYSGDCSMMKMMCDKNILLKGFGISSSSDFDSLHEVQIVIKQDRTFLLNKIFGVEETKSHVVKVMLESDVRLNSGLHYSVIVTFHFSGEHDQGICRRGKGGSKVVHSKGCVFEFDRPDSGGLISEIIYSHCH